MGNNNLYKVENTLRSIAKRYKSVKYSLGLAILFLMMGVSAFSEEVVAQEAVAQQEVMTTEQIASSKENLRNSVGSNQYNFGLSRRRAESVKAKLLEFGLAEDRIVGIEAMGEEQPIATNATKEGRAQNRRVEFKLVQRETVQGATATPEASESK